MAVDPGFDTSLANPQTWNKYTYVRNNPIKAIDPNGAFTVEIHAELSGIGLRGAGFGDAATALATHANVRQDSLFGGRLHWRAHGTGFGDHAKIRTDAQAYAGKQLKKAVKAANRGDMESAVGHLGKGLHTVQDLVAHKDFPNLIENIPRWGEHNANDANPSDDDLAEATEDTSNYIDAFLSAVPGGVEAVNQALANSAAEGQEGRGTFFSTGQKPSRSPGGYVDAEGTHWHSARSVEAF